MPEYSDILAVALRDHALVLAVLSERRPTSPQNINRVTVRPTVVRGEEMYQFATRADNRETHDNLSSQQAAEKIELLLATVFADAHLYTTTADYAIRINKGGRERIKTSPPTRVKDSADHDRPKQYLIPEDVPCPFLIEIGVSTAAGKVRSSKRAKFRQINRFLELVADIVPSLPSGKLRVVDFGCGKSYLTFALHHLLTVLQGREVVMTGLDRKVEVIDDCNRIRDALGCEGLEFRAGDIADYVPDGDVDLVVSLHACDTATDDAIKQAARWNAQAILAVPCCQHELAGTIDVAALRPILKHGILKERFAALATDALRALALEQAGYRTQVIEFIDMEHTAKNLLIRAIRREGASTDKPAESFSAFKEHLKLGRIKLDDMLGSEESD
jgi:SAM-dependent methyltransferase